MDVLPPIGCRFWGPMHLAGSGYAVPTVIKNIMLTKIILMIYTSNQKNTIFTKAMMN